MTQVLHGETVQFCLTLRSKFRFRLCQILPITANEKNIAGLVSCSGHDAYNAVPFHFLFWHGASYPSDRKVLSKKGDLL